MTGSSGSGGQRQSSGHQSGRGPRSSLELAGVDPSLLSSSVELPSGMYGDWLPGGSNGGTNGGGGRSGR